MTNLVADGRAKHTVPDRRDDRIDGCRNDLSKGEETDPDVWTKSDSSAR
jgi:hypothetical protein